MWVALETWTGDSSTEGIKKRVCAEPKYNIQQKTSCDSQAGGKNWG